MPDTSMQVCAYGLTKVFGGWHSHSVGKHYRGRRIRMRSSGPRHVLLAASLPRLLSRDEPKDAKSSRGSSTVARLANLAALPAVISHQCCTEYHRQALPCLHIRRLTDDRFMMALCSTDATCRIHHFDSRVGWLRTKRVPGGNRIVTRWNHARSGMLSKVAEWFVY